jgi:chorismate synthase
MAGNTFGRLLTLTSFGESHGPAIGGVLDGVPPGIDIDIHSIQFHLNRRRPGQSPYHTTRSEEDTVEILSGLLDGKTTGTPISFLIRNCQSRSRDYHEFASVFRPGHGDYGYQVKYGIRDYRGGGRASARETAVRVTGGAIARLVLSSVLKKPVCIQGAVVQIGAIPLLNPAWMTGVSIDPPLFCPDPSTLPLWEAELEEAQSQGRSLGALVEVRAEGVPAGLGEPVYDKLDADLAKALMSINAVKGVEIGDGFSCVSAPVGFDEMALDPDLKTALFLSNRSGGILAGISTGQPIVCRVAFKPTSSTRQTRQALTQENTSVSVAISGRHDPCVGLRAVPIVEAMVALTLVDHWLRFRGQCGIQLSHLGQSPKKFQ